MKTVKVLVLFVFGAILGTVCDLFHVVNDITGYNYKSFGEQAWWTPVIFGLATLAIALSHASFDQKWGANKRLLTWPKVLYGLMGFVFLYYISGYWSVLSHMKFVILALGALTVWYMFDKSGYGVIYMILTAIIGCAVEISLVKAGQFYYTNAEIFGIVLWLPFLYMTGSVAVGNLGRKLFQGEPIATECSCGRAA